MYNEFLPRFTENKEVRVKKVLILGMVLILVLLLTITYVGAAPRATGVEPLYDSGWVLTTSGFQEFEHGLNAWPTLISIYVADNSDGDFPSAVFDNRNNGSYNYGGSVRDVYCTSLRIYWQANGIAYNHNPYINRWYQRGTDYARVLIFSADGAFGGPPCRP